MKLYSFVLPTLLLLSPISKSSAEVTKSDPRQLIQIITLPQLSPAGANELLAVIKNELGIKGYKKKSFSHDKLAELPDQLNRVDVYVKKVGSKQMVIRFGVIKYLTRPSRMWIESVNIENNQITANADIDALVQVLNEETIGDLKLEKQLTQSKTPARLVPLPRLSVTQQSELINEFKLELNIKGYSVHNEFSHSSLKELPINLENDSTLVSHFGDKVRVIRLGTISYATRPSKLWLEALEFTTDGKTLLNSDLNEITTLLSEIIIPGISSKTYRVSDLEKKILLLSYASSTEAILSLKGQGLSAYSSTDTIPKEFSFNDLPVILEMPAPHQDQTGLVGESAGDSKSSLTAASKLNNETVSSQLSKLLIIFHPEHAKQYASIEKNILDLIDKPARQVLIEGMVLEISETGLEELGVEWELSHGTNEISMTDGILDSTSTETFLSATLDKNLTDINYAKDWSVKLKALIQSGKAEILSRPSVLTLDNRQATIRVGEDEPIAKTTTNNNNSSTSFEYLPTGILLNVRPRISADGEIVSMAIDTTVSQKGDDVVIKDDQGNNLATAPRISTRRVQTYATITNNTPFIIGGLISRDKKEEESTLPILGEIPLIGKLFNSRSSESTKREVIIVLTPYVLPEQDVSRTTPKDDELFDSIGNNLFRSSYRIKKSDLTDLSFLTENPRIKELQNIVEKLADYGSPLAKENPYKQFAGGHFPGEQTIIQNMIYSLVSRKGIQEQVELEEMKFFKKNENYGFLETNLNSEIAHIQRQIPEEEYTWWENLLIFLKIRDENKLKDKYKDNGLALVMTYTVNHDSIDMRTIFNEPVPRIEIVECSGRKDWQKKLAELNKQSLTGQSHYTIVINNQDDLARLKAAIMMKEIVAKNGGVDALNLKRFEAGKQLMLPDFKKGQSHFIDAEVARYFVESNYYYPKLIDAVEGNLSELINSLQKLFLHTDYAEHGLTGNQLSKIGLATPIDIYLKANRPLTKANYSIFKPVINGKLNDAIWETTEIVSDFIVAKTRNMSKLTEAKVAYDDKNLYLAIRCNEPMMDRLKETVIERDGKTWDDDSIGIYIDTNYDRKTFYQFEITPLNTIADFKIDGKADISFNANIRSAISKDSNGWTVEVAIPWRTMETPVPTSKTKMGLFISRKRQAAKERQQFPFLNGSNHRAEFYGDLIFK